MNSGEGSVAFLFCFVLREAIKMVIFVYKSGCEVRCEQLARNLANSESGFIGLIELI